MVSENLSHSGRAVKPKASATPDFSAVPGRVFDRVANQKKPLDEGRGCR
jgi:hypothetical protein